MAKFKTIALAIGAATAVAVGGIVCNNVTSSVEQNMAQRRLSELQQSSLTDHDNYMLNFMEAKGFLIDQHIVTWSSPYSSGPSHCFETDSTIAECWVPAWAVNIGLDSNLFGNRRTDYNRLSPGQLRQSYPLPGAGA